MSRSISEKRIPTDVETIYRLALGESCARPAECFVTAEPDQIECRNGVCECPFGTQKDVERQVCRPVAKKSK